MSERVERPLNQPEKRGLVDSWRNQPGMLGLRYGFLQDPMRTWLADGTLDWLWAAAAALPHAWVVAHAEAVSDRMEYVDPFGPEMMVLAVLAIVTLLEATRRAVEVGLAWMVLGSLAYMEFGHLLPGVLNTRRFTPAEILEAAWLVPTAVGSSRDGFMS